MSRVHVIGAGLAGLAAALRLVRAGATVTVHEAAAQAGGRCRSYHDAKLGRVIDNGNHLLLSANHAALDYLAEIGAGDSLLAPPEAVFPFVDIATVERWAVRPNGGPLPWWILSPGRRIPGTGLGDHLALARILGAGEGDTVADRIGTRGAMWRCFWQPFTVAVLNAAPEAASARLLGLALRQSFLKGGGRCRPMIAARGLGPSFIDPALAHLARAGVEIGFGRRLRGLRPGADGHRVAVLEFGGDEVALAATDQVVLAVPPEPAARLVPGLKVPLGATMILNAHMVLDQAPAALGEVPFLGVIGGLAQWIFGRDRVVSVTVSAADDHAETSADDLARRLWRDVAAALNLDPSVEPPIRIVKEKRATFAQTPENVGRRPAAAAALENLALAGDWTATGYPATIDGAIRSGRRAAQLALARLT